jgi:plasmid stabilization system protein ParE
LQVSRLKNRPEILKNHIHVGRIVPEFSKVDIRELIEGRYRIVYKIVSKCQIDILTIHHSSRNMDKGEL